MSIPSRTLAVSVPYAAWRTDVLEVRRLSVSVLRWVPASSHSWLRHRTLVLSDHLNTSCSRPGGQQSIICLSCSLDCSESSIMALVPMPYFAISIQVCRVHDRGTAARPHHADSDGRQGDDVIGPSAPVCWLTSYSSFCAISTRSLSHPFSIWCRTAILLAVFAVCQFVSPRSWKVSRCAR